VKEVLKMADLQKLKAEILADGRIDEEEVTRLRAELYADGKIDKEEVELLIALRNGATSVCPSFEKLFFQAVKDNVLTDGSIDAEEASWLREMLFADGKIDEGEKQFLRQLRSEARKVCPEFEALCDECLK
jgi:uncharacterized tellurite resistance protein B-like protein